MSEGVNIKTAILIPETLENWKYGEHGINTEQKRAEQEEEERKTKSGKT